MTADVVGRWLPTLREPTVPVQVGADTFHLHRAVLQKSGFLANTLKEDMADDGPLKLELPCSAEEFALLVVALYTGEEIGSPRLPVPDLATALRLARAADQLLITEFLPELERVLPSVVKTYEDQAAAADAAPTLSPALQRSLKSVCSVADNREFPGFLVTEKICSGISVVDDVASQEMIWSMLTAFRGQWDAERVTAAARAVVRDTRKSHSQLAFAARIAIEKLDVQQAMLIFMDWPTGDDLKEAFQQHVLRCARERALTTMFRYREQESYVHHFFTKPDPFMEALQACPPDHLERVVQSMTAMKPVHLANILSAQVLLFLPSHVEALVQPLLHGGGTIASWAMKERLEALPLHLKRAVCVALAPFAGRLNDGVADEVKTILEGSST